MSTLVVIAIALAAVLAAVAVVLSAVVLRVVSRSGTATDPRPQLDTLTQRVDQVVDRARTDAAEQASALRGELRATEQEARREASTGRQELLAMLGAAHEQVVTALAGQQQSAGRLGREGLTAQAASATALQEAQVAAAGMLRQSLETATASLQERQAAELARLREEITAAVTALGERAASTQRDTAAATQTALTTSLDGLRGAIEQRLGAVGEGQEALRTHLTQGADTARTEQGQHLERLRTSVGTSVAQLQKAQREALAEMTSNQAREVAALRETVTAAQKDLRTEVAARLKDLGEAQGRSLQRAGSTQAEHVANLTQSLTAAQTAMRTEVTKSLDAMATSNGVTLEAMRVTVQEKLDDTLTKRLDSSFTRVTESLKIVGEGLGDMQRLAQGVGSLQRTLTNVKHRGAWAELQLESLLADLLTGDQFVRQHRINPGSSELVDFAVRLPGTKDGTPVWLGIDSKFPMDVYERFQAAWEAGEAAGLKMASKELVDRVAAEARSISGKYVNPPHTTDFAVMYLPTEGLFAEVVRQPGLVHDLRTKHKVVVAGPTTLTALLSSMSMGFRTLAIEKRSSEVWEVLGSVKAEFERSAVVWERLEKQLQTAGKTAHETGVRHRAVERRLRVVESRPAEGALPRQVGIDTATDVDPLETLVGIDGYETAD
ncbi:DNA recombination protein RmuC [Pseudokineococcus basanitobsidens]|uniref:DNA recombination protein RmuC n=1 Tax=Pseudokineococcus basanitobsidens TaxID=1926649 RepID=A0ABU8RFA1_9ACTN